MATGKNTFGDLSPEREGERGREPLISTRKCSECGSDKVRIVRKCFACGHQEFMVSPGNTRDTSLTVFQAVKEQPKKEL